MSIRSFGIREGETPQTYRYRSNKAIHIGRFVCSLYAQLLHHLQCLCHISGRSQIEHSRARGPNFLAPANGPAWWNRDLNRSDFGRHAIGLDMMDMIDICLFTYVLNVFFIHHKCMNKHIYAVKWMLFLKHLTKILFQLLWTHVILIYIYIYIYIHTHIYKCFVCCWP